MKQFSGCLARTAVFILVELGGAKQVECMTVAGLNVNQVLGCLHTEMNRTSWMVFVMLFVDTVSQSGSRARGITTQERSVTVICLFSKQRKALISRTRLACRVASLESSATRM